MIEKPIKSFFVDSSLAQLRNQLKAHVRKMKAGEKNCHRSAGHFATKTEKSGISDYIYIFRSLDLIPYRYLSHQPLLTVTA